MVFGVSPFTKPSRPPALMGGSALQKVPPNARRLVGRLVRATGQDQNKKGPEDGFPPFRAQRANKLRSAAPLGDGRGASIGEWAGALGQADPAVRFTGGAAGLAGRMPASWRTDCPHECEVRICSQRDSAAATPADNATLCDALFRGEGNCKAGSRSTKRIKVGARHERPHAQCLLSVGSEALVPANPAAKPSVTCRVCWFVSGAVAPARSQAALTLRRQVECDDCDAKATGRAQQAAHGAWRRCVRLTWFCQ